MEKNLIEYDENGEICRINLDGGAEE